LRKDYKAGCINKLQKECNMKDQRFLPIEKCEPVEESEDDDDELLISGESEVDSFDFDSRKLGKDRLYIAS